MSILFRRIRWKNFLSTGNQFTELELDRNGTTLIIGSNGSGKSTFLDALTFALFGKPFRNINKPQLINSIIKKDAVVEVEFDSGADAYKIIRGLKPVIFEVYKNDVLVNQSSDVRDYQEIVEKNILKINYKSFCQVVVLGSASFIPFMQLPAAQRRSIIEDLLDLQIFTTMNIILKEQIQENLENICEADQKVILVKEKIKIVQEHLREQSSSNEKKIEQLVEKNSNLEKAKLLASEVIEKHRMEIEKNEELIKDKASLEKKLKALNVYKNQIDTKLAIIESEIKFLENNESCPTCKQSIEKHFRCDSIEDKTSKLSELKEGLEKLSETQASIETRLLEIQEISKTIDSLNSLISMQILEIKHADMQISQNKKDIVSIKDSIKTESNDRIVDYEKQFMEASTVYNEYQEEKKVLATAGILLKDSGIKTTIINQYVPIINKLITKYLSIMDFHCQFEINNQFEETIKSRHRDEFSYASFSEGEKQRINLAILFTWRAIAKMRNSLSTNLLILDEIFDSSIDAAGVDQLMSIIQSQGTDTNLYVISHKEQMLDRFNTVIKFSKKSNFSHMEDAA